MRTGKLKYKKACYLLFYFNKNNKTLKTRDTHNFPTTAMNIILNYKFIKSRVQNK